MKTKTNKPKLLMNLDAKIQQNISKLNPTKNYAPGRNGLYPGMQGWFNIQKSTKQTKEGKKYDINKG